MSTGFIVGEQIKNSPINNSKSKQAFSFGKGDRFSKKSALSASAGMMYNLPSSFNKRTTSFGYGQRGNFVGNSKNAPPYYNIPSDFDQKKAHGFSFGISREYYKKVCFSLRKKKITYI